MKIFKTTDRLKVRESHLRLKIASADWFATADREIMSGIDGALHLIAKPGLSETELAKLRDRLKMAGVTHNLPKQDPRLVRAGNTEYNEDEIRALLALLPSVPSFAAMLKELENGLWVKKDALIAENRIVIRQMRGLGKARKALNNLLRDHGAGARRALEAMAKGKPAPSWILRSVAVAAR
ncbi:MAG: hypothetical protein Q8R12_03680 [bacterium]|nr:hypothetical protein [bacterium]